MTEAPIVVENREELIFLLSEASELEHMVMLEYLFAAFSLKSDAGEGLTGEQLEAVRRWERVISEVAAQEMLHLASASNLLTAIGGAPHFSRPNFPQPAKYYPPGFEMALMPFSEQALGCFVYYERPEGMEHNAPELQLASEMIASLIPGGVVVPHEQQFATVGHLYRGIEQGFRRLVEKYGEQRVFVGPPEAQATWTYFWWPELVAVTDLASALAAIETIVEQGEGARSDRDDAHFGMFLRVLVEYLEFKRRDPDFEPARPVTAAWVRPPVDAKPPNPTSITDPTTARVADLFNATYEVMLQMLVRFFAHTEETEEELQTLSSTAVDLMSLIKPLGQLLTTLPVGAEYPGKSAGPNFEFYRTSYLLPHRHAAWVLMNERLLELAVYCARLGARPSAPPELTTIEGTFRKLARALEQHIGR